ncbi:MAG: GAF domain-containing protein [Alphaproteobacteria bacterium]
MQPQLQNEESRLAALQLYQILDSGEEQVYDDLTKIAAYIADTPMALISIVDRDRQWFKSRIGIDVPETKREYSFCSHAIQSPRLPFLVRDAKRDDRFASNPLVTGAPNIRFYFGAPLLMNDKNALGSLCVLDTKPRELSLKQIEALTALSRQVVLMLEIRKNVMALGALAAEAKPAEKKVADIDRLATEMQAIMRSRRAAESNDF